MTPAGIYIHIPFCKTRCSYCDFATGIYDSAIAQRYVEALVREINLSPQETGLVDTVYFGGGTPSMLSPQQIGRILETVQKRFQIDAAAEITMEINPGSVTKNDLA